MTHFRPPGQCCARLDSWQPFRPCWAPRERDPGARAEPRTVGSADRLRPALPHSRTAQHSIYNDREPARKENMKAVQQRLNTNQKIIT